MDDRREHGDISVEVERLQRRQRWLNEEQRPGEFLKPTEKFVPKVKEKTAGGTA